MSKNTLTAAAMTGILAAVLASPAMAQTNSPNTMGKPGHAVQSSMPNQSGAGHDSFVQAQQATEWLGSKLIGANVYGTDNAAIGEVNDVLIGNDGQVRAVVIGVGGFLGVGEKNVAVPLDALNITRKPNSPSIDKINVSYTKDQLKSAPKFAYFEPNKTETTGSNVNDKINSDKPMNKTPNNK